MSSRKKQKDAKRTLEAVPSLPKPEQDPKNIEAANQRLVWKKLNRVENAALSLRAATRFDPPDPAGPPDKFVLLDVDGPDFEMIASIRKRAILFLEALDRFEDVTRWVVDHKQETTIEADIPQLHRTVSMTPDNPLPQKLE